MVRERTPLSTHEISKYMSKLDKFGFGEEVKNLVRQDLKMGYTEEETKLYSHSKRSIDEMRILSFLLKQEDGIRMVEIIQERQLTTVELIQLDEFYKRGVPFDQIIETMSQGGNPEDLRNKLSRVLADMQEAASEQTPNQITEEEFKQFKDMFLEMQSQMKALSEIKTQGEIVLEAMERVKEFSRYEGQISELYQQIEERDVKIAHLLKEVELMKQEVEALKQTEVEKSEVSASETTVTKEAEPAITKVAEPAPTKVLKEEDKPSVFFSVSGDEIPKVEGPVTLPPLEYESAKQKADPKLIDKITSILFSKRKARKSLVSKILNTNLNRDQLSEIRIGMERGLTDVQLTQMIVSGISAERMKEIVEIAVLENKLREE